MLSINTNLSSFIAQRSMKQSTNSLNQAIERMTTGAKINHAKDNAANYHIATNMTTKLGALQVAEDNCAMGLDMISTASNALNSMSDLSSRLRSLAIQAQNQTYGTVSINALDAEMASIKSELDRIFHTTKYNGIELLNSYSTKIEPSQDVGLTSDFTPKYKGFIEDPVDYTDAEISLMNKMSEVDVDNDTISSGQYSISTAEDLAKLATMTNDGRVTGGEFVLANDIDLAPYLNGSSWTSIGTKTNSFKGSFNGNGHKVSNLYIDSTGDYYGLFGCGSKIYNIAVVDAIIDRGYGDDYAGILGGSISSVENCYTTGEIKDAGRFAGGLAGSGTNFENCYSTATISSSQEAGGLVGFGGGIKKCFATGNVRSNWKAGGLVGETNMGAGVENCFATGDVSGKEAGGLVGCSNYSIDNSYATGNVSGGDSIGGLRGSISGGNYIKNSFADGDINGYEYVGGIVGKAAPGAQIINTYANGKIQGSNFVGGIIGGIEASWNNKIKILNSIFYGMVVSDTYMGGMVGGVISKETDNYFDIIEIYNSKIFNEDIEPFGMCYYTTRYSYQGSPVLTENSSFDTNQWIKSGTLDIEAIATTKMLQIGTNGSNSSNLVFDMKFNIEALETLKSIDIKDDSVLNIIDSLLLSIDNKQTELGAITNRLESALEEISTQYENLVLSRSTLQDADIAEVSSEYIRQQILQQASATLLATANQSPSIALQLI